MSLVYITKRALNQCRFYFKNIRSVAQSVGWLAFFTLCKLPLKFVVDDVELEWVSLRVLWFSPASITASRDV